jgi:hypothetical protein
MKQRWLLSLLLGIWGCVLAWSQEAGTDVPLGSVIKNFYLPQRDEAGRLLVALRGKEAKVVSVNRTEIVDLAVELYEEGQPAARILAPRCDLWNLESRLTGQSGIRVERKDLQILSKAIEWDLKNRRGVLHGGVRVVLYGLPLGLTPKGNQGGEPKNGPVRLGSGS